jgi:hypothetical protein
VTYFFPEYDAAGNPDSNSPFITPEAQLTCVKPINETTWTGDASVAGPGGNGAVNETTSDGDTSAAAGRAGKGGLLAVVVGVVCTGIAALLVV